MSNRNAVFIDTCGWIAVLNADDALHKRASEQLLKLGVTGRSLVTTDWVLAETGNGLARTAARSCLAAAMRRFLESPHCRLVRVGDTLLDRALKLYDQANDKSWGLVDCASFVLMRDEGLLDAFTSDRHFTQSGFHCILPTS